MDILVRHNIEQRIKEIDERLRDLDAAEMSEGGLFYAPDSEEIEKLYQDRERLRRELEISADRAA